MIRLLIFDLDGTLVRTEYLKAVSYANAARELRPEIAEEDALAAFAQCVGASRRDMALHFIEALGLERAATKRMAELGVDAPWQALVALRMRYYEAMMADPEVVRANQWPCAVELLQAAKRLGCRAALATSSTREATDRVLRAIGLDDVFDFTATADDVEYGKPDPEIFRLIAAEMGVAPTQCMVLEDSLVGIRGAIAAGMWCIALPTTFTRNAVLRSGLIDERWIVQEPNHAMRVFEDAFAEHLHDSE